MYLQIDLNDRGKIEIDEKVLKKLVDFSVENVLEGKCKNSSEIAIYHENSIFILIKLLIKGKIDVKIDTDYIANFLNGIIEKTIGTKPKKIAFAYIHNS